MHCAYAYALGVLGCEKHGSPPSDHGCMGASRSSTKGDGGAPSDQMATQTTKRKTTDICKAAVAPVLYARTFGGNANEHGGKTAHGLVKEPLTHLNHTRAQSNPR